MSRKARLTRADLVRSLDALSHEQRAEIRRRKKEWARFALMVFSHDFEAVGDNLNAEQFEAALEFLEDVSGELLALAKDGEYVVSSTVYGPRS